MAGVEGRMKLALKHTAMSVEDKAAVTSEVFSSKRKAEKSGAKRKAEKDGAKKRSVKGGTRKREKGGASKGKEVKGTTKRKEVKGTTKRKAEKGTTADDLEAVAMEEEAEDTSGDEWVPGGTMQLPKEYVDWILSRKRVVLEEDLDEYYNRMINDPDRDEAFYTKEYLEEERELMRNMAAQYQRNGDRFEKFQDWVRLQLKEKGYVEVGEAYLAQRARLRQLVTQEQWNVMFRDMKLDDNDEHMIQFHKARAAAAVKNN